MQSSIDSLYLLGKGLEDSFNNVLISDNKIEVQNKAKIQKLSSGNLLVNININGTKVYRQFKFDSVEQALSVLVPFIKQAEDGKARIVVGE